MQEASEGDVEYWKEKKQAHLIEADRLLQLSNTANKTSVKWYKKLFLATHLENEQSYHFYQQYLRERQKSSVCNTKIISLLKNT